MQRSLLAIAFVAIIPLAANAGDLRLVCTVQKSSDGTAQRTVPRPVDLIAVATSADGTITVTSKLHGRQLIGRVTEHVISGQWRGQDSSEEIYINRYTTEYRYRIVFADGARPVISNSGSCQPAGPQ
jgi:hypothetical protein